jgi:leucyl-tRNA synthetase
VNFVNGRSLPIVFLAPDEQQNEEFFLKARLGFTAKSSFDKSLASSFGLSKHVKIQQIDADKILQKATEADLGGYQTSRTLQDWVVSRQRAWGTPIPILVDQDNDDICRPVPIDLLPVLSEQRGQLMGDNGRKFLS